MLNAVKQLLPGHRFTGQALGVAGRFFTLLRMTANKIMAIKRGMKDEGQEVSPSSFILHPLPLILGSRRVVAVNGVTTVDTGSPRPV
jgi:hypothetical protein